MRTVNVIGAGAAGIMAALTAAREGAHVRLFEKNDIVGKKMGITGKGRCNLTNTCSMDEFIARTPGNGRFLYSAYQQFTNIDLIHQVNEWGLATKEERGGRVFPKSDSAIEVRKLFYHKLRDFGVEIHFNDAVRSINHDDDILAVVADSGTYFGEACIVTTGGMSYPVTGSTGDGYEFASVLGHTVTSLKPSLIPFTTKEKWVQDLSGLSLRNVDVSVWKKGKKLASHFGELLITHFGVSGPCILVLSSEILRKKQSVYPLQLRINLKPALSEEKLDARLQRDFTTYIRKQAVNALRDLLPQSLIPIVLEQAGIEAHRPVNQISREQRLDLVHALQALTLTVTGTRPLEEAIVTAGGVSVREIDPKTMESKLVRQLYFAGEVIDIDAYTGGYNLQAAFSTGYVAGKNAAHGGE